MCIRDSLNEALPEDIRVKEMTLVKNGFHARFNAKGKRYEYFIDTREKPDVFTRKYCFHYPHELNISAMEEAAGYLIGTHDFAGFTDCLLYTSLAARVHIATAYIAPAPPRPPCPRPSTSLKLAN